MTSIVSDTTTPIVLGKLERYDLLSNLFEKIYIPDAVIQEVLKKEDDIYEKITANPLFEIKKVSDRHLLSILNGLLDYGESEAIALAKEMQLILLIDEKKGRKIALNMGLEIIGLMGILTLNVKKAYLSNQEAITLLEQIKTSGFRVSRALEEQFLRAIGEK